MQIAILGGGHGSHAAAADLALAGHEVRWWRRDAAALAPVVEAGNTLVLKDRDGAHEARVALATADIGAAVRGAELVVVPVPATAQLDIAAALAPHLADGQVVFLPPGTFGSYVMAQAVRAAGSRARVRWAETGTLPYLARKHGSREVNLSARAVRLPTGVWPARDADATIAVIRRAYASVHACGDALSGALMNAGPVIHPPLMVMNAARCSTSSAGTSTPRARSPRCARSPMRSTASASPCARPGATAPRTTRSPTTTRATAGCTATRIDSS